MDLSFVPLPNVRPGDKSPRDRSRVADTPDFVELLEAFWGAATTLLPQVRLG